MASGKRSVLVTGGCGFIGAALVRSLANDGAHVRVLDDLSRGSTARLSGVGGRLELISADVRDEGAVRAAARGIDLVCHLAYVNGTEFFYTKPEVVLEVAVKGMMNVLDACIDAGVRDLLLVSSSEVYHDPPTIPTDETAPLSIPDLLNPRYSYSAGKIISELLAINYGRKHFDRVCVVRPHNTYGPDMGWEHVIPQLATRLARLAAGSTGSVSLPVEGSGKETRAFVHINDLIAGILLVIERGEHLGIYHIGTEEEITIEQLAKELGRCFGRDVEIVPSAAKPGSPLRRCPNIGRIRRLGFTPRVGLREGLAETVRWYRDQLPSAAGPAPR